MDCKCGCSCDKMHKVLLIMLACLLFLNAFDGCELRSATNQINELKSRVLCLETQSR